MIEPNWQPMDTMPEGVTLAWLYGFDGVKLGQWNPEYDGWYTVGDRRSCRVLAPSRWTAFLKPPPPEDIRL